MSLIFKEKTETCEWMVWRMEESAEALSSLLHPSVECPFTAPQRCREFYTVRRMLADCGLDPHKLHHSDNGAPFLEGGPFLSISHTRDYAALLLSREKKRIGIDIEMSGDRFFRVEDHYLHPTESRSLREELPEGMALHQALGIWWNAKEALYKAAGKRIIRFTEDFCIYGLRGSVLPSPAPFSWQGSLHTSFESVSYRLDYKVADDFSLVCCFSE